MRFRGLQALKDRFVFHPLFGMYAARVMALPNGVITNIFYACRRHTMLARLRSQSE